MQNPFVHGVGGVVSADIAVPDHERELDFYSKILTTGDAPLWRDDLMNNQGTPVIGLGARIPEYESLPLQWTPHFQVADVAASAAYAIEMGGEEIMHSKTDDGQSQWAALVDHVGAAFGVIPAVTCESDTTRQNERLGCISWLSLTVPDALSSRDFYQRVVGWNAQAIEIEDDKDVAKFEMRIDAETAAAEIRQSRNEQSGIPPVWLLHLPVGDLVESLRRVSEGGGEVIKEFALSANSRSDRSSHESVDAKYAVIRDPVGVYLVLQAG